MAALDAYQLDPCRRELGQRIHKTLSAMLPEGGALALGGRDIGLLLEKPPEARLGDFALPCFRFAKDLKKKPPEIAQALATALSTGESPWISRVEVVGAFLNIYIDQRRLAATVLPELLSGQWFQRLREERIKPAEKVMIEYSQPNTLKDFHVGHSRNLCLGISLVHLFRFCGYDVTAANYYGDDGTHISTVLWYIDEKKPTPPASERYSEWFGQLYVQAKQAVAAAEGAEKQRIEARISAIHRQVEQQEGEIFDLWKRTRAWSLQEFKEIYQWFEAPFDVDFFESECSLEAQSIVDEYLESGIFVLDDGAVGVDLKPYKLGFCILRKRDGNTLYATKDLVLARRKFKQYQVDRAVYVVADEQNHHFKQVFKVLELMGFKQASQCFHLSYGMVTLPEGKMSSRDGSAVPFTTLRDTMLAELDKVLAKYKGEWSDAELKETASKLCAGAIKYGMISTDPKSEIVFDLKDWLSFEGNSGPYLMYSYARTRSILRKAAEQGFAPGLGGVGLLDQASEHELLRFLYDFNEVVANATEQYKPSLLATHLFYTCKAFNRFYADVPVLKADNAALRDARLALIEAFARTLKQGLALLGMTPPERM
jgi:arginyl-tRNA synthetase